MTTGCKKILKSFIFMSVCLFGIEQAAYSSDLPSEEGSDTSHKSKSLRSRAREARKAAKDVYDQTKKATEESSIGMAAKEKFEQAKGMGQDAIGKGRDILQGGKQEIKDMVQQAVCAFNIQPLQSLQSKVAKLQQEITQKKASLSVDMKEMQQKKRLALQQKRQELEAQINKIKAEWAEKLDAKEKEEDEKIADKTSEESEKIAEKTDRLQEFLNQLKEMREKCPSAGNSGGSSDESTLPRAVHSSRRQ